MIVQRNLGIIIALMVFGCTVYLVSTEYISAKKSKGEVLLFRRGKVPEFAPKPDVESHVDGQEVQLARTKTIPDAPASIQKQTAIFHWDSVNYDIKIKKEPRRLLDDVDGWVKRKIIFTSHLSPILACSGSPGHVPWASTLKMSRTS